MPKAARHTVCPAVVSTQTSYIMWNDAEQAAATGAPAVSPYKRGTPSDREWHRFYHRARSAPSGITSLGHRVRQRRVCDADGYHATPEAAALVARYNAQVPA